MASAPRQVVNTLSQARPRVVASTFAGLTLKVERAAARSRNAADPNERRQFVPNKQSELLSKLAARAPGARIADVTPFPGRQSGSSDRGGLARSSSNNNNNTSIKTTSGGRLDDRRSRPERTLADLSSDKLTRARSRTFKPELSGRSAQASTPGRASQFTKEVSAADRIAASLHARQAGDGFGAAGAPRRTYKDRHQARETQLTRFAGEQQQQPQRPKRRSGGSGASATGGGRDRKGTRQQELERARRDAIEARKTGPRPAPIPYDFPGLAMPPSVLYSTTSAAADASSTSALSVYRRIMALDRDSRDAVRLVAANKSIDRKDIVLDTIDVWIPSSSSSSSP